MLGRLTAPRSEALVLAGLAGSVALRAGLAGDAGAGSVPAALVFATILAVFAGVAGWRLTRPSAQGLAWGVLGAAVLVALPLVSRGHWSGTSSSLPVSAYLQWAPAVAAVAVTEEVILRGVVFNWIQEAARPPAALAVTAVIFALIHVPFYGWGALPLDLAVGVWLGALRIVSGGVTAPATAHALADLATWWLL